MIKRVEKKGGEVLMEPLAIWSSQEFPSNCRENFEQSFEISNATQKCFQLKGVNPFISFLNEKINTRWDDWMERPFKGH